MYESEQIHGESAFGDIECCSHILIYTYSCLSTEFLSAVHQNENNENRDKNTLLPLYGFESLCGCVCGKNKTLFSKGEKNDISNDDGINGGQ